MFRLGQIRGPLIAGLLWSTLALASTALREWGGAVVLIWLPSAIAVAALYVTPTRRWPGLLAALLVAQVATSLLRGTPPVPAFGFALANIVEAVVCTTVGIRVLGGRAKSPQSFDHVAGLFAAAVFAPRFSLKLTAFSEAFITTTAIEPSVFLNAVVASASVVDDAATRFAPGRMNFEKWPM